MLARRLGAALRSRLGALVPTLGLMALVLLPVRAHALEACASQQDVVRLEFMGLSATDEQTVLDLLPRLPPALYHPTELAEFERRLNNLGIFDSVQVNCGAHELRVSVREKWTLVPAVDFATGQTLADTYALLGATEYNLFGTANQLHVNAYREQRGFGATIGFNEHDYRRRGWSFGAEVSGATSARLVERDAGWRSTSVTLELSARSPPLLHQYLNYVAGAYASSESVYDARGVTAPPSTRVAQSFMGLSWDAYEWHDLTPRGLQTSLWLSIGGLFGAARPQPRHTAELSLRGALPLTHHSVLVIRSEAAVQTRGNGNYGFALGSVGGVRGLKDSTYYTWAQVVSNLELRQSLQIWPRWAIQAVAFGDVAAFEQMTERGARGNRVLGLSLGVGARIVPTWIASVALRLDASRLLSPEHAWFTQLGLNQYF